MANEHPLIEELRNGSEKAFKTLIQLHQDKVLNTCLGFVPNMQDAEDLSQEVFVEVYRSIQSFRGDAKLSTWLYRIASTKCLEFLRKKRREKRGGGLSILQLEKAPTPVEFNHPGIDKEKKESAKVLFAAIRSLPENQSVALVFSKIEQLSNKEIAHVMETTEKAVESLLVRARKNLRKELEEYYKKEKS